MTVTVMHTIYALLYCLAYRCMVLSFEFNC